MELNFRIKLHLKYHSMNTSNACVYLLTVENRVIRVEMALVTAQVPCFQVFPSCISNLIGSPTWTPSLFFKLFNKVYIMAQTVESTCNVGDSGSIPVSGRSPGGGHGNPLQYSCLENPMDRGAWWAMSMHGAAKSQPQLSN